ISTRRTSLIESDSSKINSKAIITNHMNIYDENTLKNQTTKNNGYKRKLQNDQHDKKNIKTSNALVQIRSSSRLKQKHQPMQEQRSSTIKRRLSAELLLISTLTDDKSHSEHKYIFPSLSKQQTTNECQTTDDIIQVFHQPIQTNYLIKSDK
ncbi:unnamed protein product, partial [Rotaria magnacalcarata]